MTLVRPNPQQMYLYAAFCHHLNKNDGKLDANDAAYFKFLDNNRVEHAAVITSIKLCKNFFKSKYFILHLDGRTTGVEGGSFYLTPGAGKIVSNLNPAELPVLVKPVVEQANNPCIPPPSVKKKKEPEDEWTREEVIDLLTRKAHVVGRMLGTGYDLLEPLHGEWIEQWLVNPEGLRVLIHQAHRDSYKCFGKGTKVLMYDGTSKKIEDICIGDTVMGWDSTPRKVLETHSGTEKMYRITLNKNGESYTCNKNHILTLKQRPIKNNKFHCVDEYRYEKDRNIINIPIEDFLNSPASRTNGPGNTETFFKHFKVGVEFDAKEVRIPPYILGCWLGDGASRKVGITTMDSEIRDEFRGWAMQFGLTEHIDGKDGAKCCTYTYSRPQYKGMPKAKTGNGHNKARDLFASYDLLGNKHIPHDYIENSRENRLELLAGLLDTDGCYGSCHFTFTTSKHNFAHQVEFLARSLGFHATAKKVKTHHTYNGIRKDSFAWQVYINGRKLHEIPTRLPCKKASIKKTDDDRHLSFSQKIEPIGTGEFTGIVIEGDGMFLLDNFLVVHNTSCLRLCLSILLILQPLKTAIVIRKSEDAVKEIVNGVSKILDTPLFHTFINILYPDIRNKGGFKKTVDTALAIDTNLNVSLSGEYQLRALGLGSPLTGKHSSLIVTDDIVSTADRESEAERRATISKYQEMMNLLSNNKGFSDTRIINIGTPWHEEDAFSLMERGLRNKTEEQEALEALSIKERTPAQEERIRRLNMKRGKFVYNCYQTGLMTAEDIEWKRKVLNDECLFAANYMLSLVSDEEKPFPRINNVGKYSKSYFADSWEVFAAIDAAYDGVDTCALGIGAYDWKTNTVIAYGRLWKGISLDQNYMELAEIMFECGVQTLFMETNTDKGLMGGKYRELGFNVEGYHESQNKHTKIVSTIRPFWREVGDLCLPCVQFVEETDEDYLSQIHNYKKGVKKDDAPDNLACLLLKSKFGALSIRLT